MQGKLLSLLLAIALLTPGPYGAHVSQHASDNTKKTHVIVVGAGVSGLAAAHALLEKGFAVTLLERGLVPGGLARAGLKDGKFQDVCWKLTSNNYRNFRAMLQKIPANPHMAAFGHKSAEDALLEVKSGHVLRYDSRAKCDANHTFPSILEFDYSGGSFSNLFASLSPFRPWEIYKILKIAIFSLVSGSRRLSFFANTSWYDLMELDSFAPEGRELVKGFMGVVYGLDVEQADGNSGLNALANLFGEFILTAKAPGGQLFSGIGPASEVIFDPWIKHLVDEYSLDIRFDSTVNEVSPRSKDGKLQGVDVQYSASSLLNYSLSADYVVLALPPRQLKKLLENPAFTVLEAVCEQYVMSVTLHFSEKVLPSWLQNVPAWYVSPWIIISIPYDAFWHPTFVNRTGAEQILNVGILAGKQAGLFGKSPFECSLQELEKEVLEQMGLTWAKHLLTGLTYSPTFSYDHAGFPIEMLRELKYSNNAGVQGINPDYKLYLSQGIVIAGGLAGSVADYWQFSLEAAATSGLMAANAIIEAASPGTSLREVLRWRRPWSCLEPLRQLDDWLFDIDPIFTAPSLVGAVLLVSFLGFVCSRLNRETFPYLLDEPAKDTRHVSNSSCRTLPFVTWGYRRELGFFPTLSTLFVLNNESGHIWSQLIALLIIRLEANSVFPLLEEARDSTGAAYGVLAWVFFLFIHTFSSFTAHYMGSMNHFLSFMLFQLDFLMTGLGTFPLYCAIVMTCSLPSFPRAYCAALALLTSVFLGWSLGYPSRELHLISASGTSKSENAVFHRRLRAVGVLFGLGLCYISVVHALILGPDDFFTAKARLMLGLHALFCLLGGLSYVLCIPERWFPSSRLAAVVSSVTWMHLFWLMAHVALLQVMLEGIRRRPIEKIALH